MFQNKNLKRNATSAIVEVAEVAPLIALCPSLPILQGYKVQTHT